MNFVYRLRHLSSHLVRKVTRSDRQPVGQMTERDYEYAALMLGFTAGAGFMAFALLVIITFYWSPSCGL